MEAKVIGIGDSTPKKKKTLTEAGYAQGPSGVSSSNPQGILPVPNDQGRSEEAGYAQGQAGGNIPAGSQGILPVPNDQGEVLDNTNVESVQLQRGFMTRELFANTCHDVHE